MGCSTLEQTYAPNVFVLKHMSADIHLLGAFNKQRKLDLSN